MIGTIIVCVFFGGWSFETIGKGGGGFQGVNAGIGRNDDTIRIYGGCDDQHVYEFTWDGTRWVKANVGSGGGTIHGLWVGQGRNDGINRLYASCWEMEFWEFSWDGTKWVPTMMGNPGNYSYDAPVAKGRNDDTLRVYTGTNEGRIYEFTWRENRWNLQYIGARGIGDAAQHDLYVDYGRNDDTLRVYGACTDGKLWELTFDGTKWNSMIIDSVGTTLWGVVVGEGRNDGIKRVYVCTGKDERHGGVEPGKVYEYTWNEEKWEKKEVGTAPRHLYGITLGKARNDGKNRIYVGCGDGHVYEFTHTDTGWIRENIGGPGRNLWFHDLTIAKGRNDDTLRVYAGCGDHHIYEFTYRPDIKIIVDPDREDSTNPGVPIRYYEWVVNVGTDGDTIDITFYNSIPTWEVKLYDSTGTKGLSDSDKDGKPDVGYREPFDTAFLYVEILPPEDALAGTTNSIILFGRSSIYPAIYDSAILVTKIKKRAEIMVYPDTIDSIIGGESIDYHLFVKNNGNLKDLVDLQPLGTKPDWEVKLLDLKGNPLADSDKDGRVDIGPVGPYGDSLPFIARVIAPQKALAGTADTTFIEGESNASPGMKDAARLITIIKTLPQVKVEPDTIDSTYAGIPIVYPMLLTNLGNGPDCIGIVLSKGRPSWSYTLYDSSRTPLLDSNGDGMLDLGTLQGFGETALFFLEIIPPLDVPPDAIIDTTLVIGVSSVDNSVREKAKVITKVIKTGVILEPDTTGIVRPRSFVTYPMRVVNQGNRKDVFDIYCNSKLGWDFKLLSTDNGLLSDKNNNKIPDTDSILPGDTFNFLLKITPPKTLGSIVGKVDTAIHETNWLKAVSIINTSVYDSAIVYTTLVPELDIHNYPNPFSDRTTFIFNVPELGDVTLKLFNRAGEYIKTLIEKKSYSMGVGYTKEWNGENFHGREVAPGLYLYVFTFTPTKGGNTRTIVKKALKIPG